jgi:regulator of RNase E activity RraB
MKKFPNDPDGQTLKLMQEKGADFSKEHGIEFFLYFNDEKSSIAAKKRLVKYGFEVEISKNSNNSDWLCLATININPGYFALNRFRQKFEKIAEELNGNYDGWGTLIE